MKYPASTYRVQLSPDFTLNDLDQILDYLESTGVSTIYSAPFFQARPGSTHGYDVIDPFTINREIGDLQQFRKLSRRLKEKDMTWLQDIVPNHMAFDGENIWLRDIFELGPDSRYYNFFDIDWEYKGLNKVMAPFLGGSLEEVLKNLEIKLKIDKRGISLNYYDHSYPASARSYSGIFEKAGENGWKKKFEDFSGNNSEWENLKLSLAREMDQDSSFKQSIEKQLEKINNSQEMLKEILELQYFLWTHWKRTEKEINYRRFFTINDLICLRMEDQKVFDAYHHYIKDLCDAGMINGLRIDHIDGLFDPGGYIKKLRKLVGEDFYIVVEKILEWDEKLPSKWNVQGTSGYDFLAEVNLLFTQAEKEEDFSENYKRISPQLADYEKLVYEKKLFILKERMAGELQNLMNLLDKLNLYPAASEPDKKKWEEALSAFLAAFPVYRIYPKKFPLNKKQQEIIETAYEHALKHHENGEYALDQIKQIFLGEADKEEDNMLYYLQRCQQFSGPLAAKGGEDTSFYIYNRLISHNEVGDSPENFGVTVDEFHQKMFQHKKNFPLSINATATHDTKRGEDARMRLNVLSEFPGEWFEKVKEWKETNSGLKKNNIPGDNEEYFIYQTLIAAMPFEGNDQPDFLPRTKAYLQKVLREAKVHSNWADPDEEYEQGVFDFLEKILKNKNFRGSLDEFRKKINGYGAVKSIGQSLVKITAPGIPDIYQGTELWDLSYVDPDNRRPVDYEKRISYISEFKGFKEDNLKYKLKQITDNYNNGKVKMFSICRALRERRKNPELFEKGDYLPMELKGEAADKILAYARRKDRDWIVSIIPVAAIDLFPPGSLIPDPGKLKGTELIFPNDAPEDWEDVYTREKVKFDAPVPLEDLFRNFPVCMLKNSK